MRLLSFFLALVVLMLTVQPVCGSARPQQPDAHCCEEGCGCKDDASGDEEDNDCKVCNPFGSCGCCASGIAVPVPAFSVLSLPASAVPVRWGGMALMLCEAEAAGFWQPPRLA